MKDYTIESFNEWVNVVDYESDKNTVTLIGENGNKIAKYGYNKFTKEDFDRFKFNKILIEDLDISIDCYKSLKRLNINTLDQLSNYKPSELRSLNFSSKTIEEIEFVMNKYKLSWKFFVEDKFGNELNDGDLVDVQNSGIFQIYKKDDELYFKPYGEDELVRSYFSNDLIKVEKEI